jgi:hypothetical protein
MYVALTWGQDYPGEDPRSSLVAHAFFITMLLVILIGEVVAYHSFDSPHLSEQNHTLGEETFGIVLIALFWSLHDGLKWRLLPAAVYTKHLESAVFAVFCASLLIILWAGGIFDRN